MSISASRVESPWNLEVVCRSQLESPWNLEVVCRSQVESPWNLEVVYSTLASRVWKTNGPFHPQAKDDDHNQGKDTGSQLHATGQPHTLLLSPLVEIGIKSNDDGNEQACRAAREPKIGPPFCTSYIRSSIWMWEAHSLLPWTNEAL
mgnify:FL=1